MIASLGMYDLPWLQAANDALWTVLARHLRAAGIDEVPARLTRDGELEDIWRSPKLLLAQSCGYPVMMDLRESVRIVATPGYRAAGCAGPDYRSAIIVAADHPAERLEDLRGSRVGVNDRRSNSGMNLLRAAIAPIAGNGAFFDRVVLTGAHAHSFAGVASGLIDVAAIDAVTLAHLRSHDPRRAERIRVLDWTAASPGLPLVTAAATTPAVLAALRGALDATLADPAASAACETLLIDGLHQLDMPDYRSIPALHEAAAAQGYAELC